MNWRYSKVIWSVKQLFFSLGGFAKVFRQLSVPKQNSRIPTFVDEAICSHRQCLGCWDRLRPLWLWHTYHAQNQSIVNLQAHQESESSSTATRPYQTRKHGTLPRHWSWWCFGNGWADGSLSGRMRLVQTSRKWGRIRNAYLHGWLVYY